MPRGEKKLAPIRTVSRRRCAPRKQQQRRRRRRPSRLIVDTPPPPPPRVVESSSRVARTQATATERTIDDRAKRSVAVQLARTVCARVRARRLSPIRTATRKSVTGTPIPFRLVSQRTKRPDTPSLDHRVNRIRRPAFATINLSARGRLQQCRRGGVFRMSV